MHAWDVQVAADAGTAPLDLVSHVLGGTDQMQDAIQFANQFRATRAELNRAAAHGLENAIAMIQRALNIVTRCEKLQIAYREPEARNERNVKGRAESIELEAGVETAPLARDMKDLGTPDSIKAEFSRYQETMRGLISRLMPTILRADLPKTFDKVANEFSTNTCSVFAWAIRRVSRAYLKVHPPPSFCPSCSTHVSCSFNSKPRRTWAPYGQVYWIKPMRCHSMALPASKTTPKRNSYAIS